MEADKNSVDLLPATAAALDALNIVGVVSERNVDMQAMAWLAKVLRYVDDDPKIFPHGKWATIQRIEGQVEEAAKLVAGRIGK